MLKKFRIRCFSIDFIIKPKKYIDIIFLILLGLLLAMSIYRHFTGGFVLSVNNYLALVLWLGVVIVKITRPEKSNYLLLLLLVLSIFNITNFTIEVFKVGFSVGYAGYFDGIHINIISFLLLVVYYFTNRNFVLQTVKILIKGSDKDREKERDKKIAFYYQKFNVCEPAEFDKIFANFKEYPAEAQIALKQIKAEKDKI